MRSLNISWGISYPRNQTGWDPLNDLNRILGNEQIKEFFYSSIAHNKISHAYIFEGEKGSGKKMLANAFSKILQCRGEGTKPCGKCSSCLQVDHHNHPDVIWVTHEKANVISVGEIRTQVINTVDIQPYKGPYKIYIIDEAEKMNPSAQNAILKTIEEPADYAVIFLLTANRGAFLPTVLSRCISLTVKPVPVSLIRRHLTDRLGIDPGMAEFYAGFSMGNVGKAMAIAGSVEFNEMREHALELVRHFHEMEDYELDGRAKECRVYKDRIREYLDIIRMWFRDILIWKTTGDQERLLFRGDFPVLCRQAERLSLASLSRIFDHLGETDRQITANVNFEAAMDLLFFAVRRLFSPS